MVYLNTMTIDPEWLHHHQVLQQAQAEFDRAALALTLARLAIRRMRKARPSLDGYLRRLRYARATLEEVRGRLDTKTWQRVAYYLQRHGR